MKRLLVATGAVLCALALGLPADAHGPDPLLGGLYGQNQVLPYRWSAAGMPPAAMRTAIAEGVADANGSRKSKAPTFAYDKAAPNAIYYGPDVPCGAGGLACLRRDTADDWFGVWFRPNGHRFDWGTLRWCELTGSPDGCYEVENVTLDELGHVLVLDHHDNFSDDSDYGDAVVQTFSRTKPRAGWNAHSFGRCDIAALQQQYDVASWTTLYSTCLDVPTSMTLSASDTSVTSGSMVRFTATLTSNGAGRLSNNPMTGRAVVLQQRTWSGWADVVTMGAGSASGTYVASVTVRASQDYRALFRKPSGEGVRSTWSGAVAMTVSASCSGTCPQSSGTSGK